MFCDVSLLAYCAAFYVQSTDESGQVSSELLFCINRIVPLKGHSNSNLELSIPKLELSAAKLASEKLHSVLDNIQFENVFAFTDSITVLCWLSKPPGLSKTFVRNRVRSIIQVLPFEMWQYVRTAANPADLGTHGIAAVDLNKSSLWCDGPAFLRESNWLNQNVLSNADLETALARC